MSSTTVQQRLAGLADDLHDAIVRNPTGSSVAGAAVSGGLIWAAIEGLQAIQKARQFRGAMCVVTGASTGIGAGCAMELARRGARVVILLARNEGALKQRCDEINRSIGAEVALPMRCDCGQAEEVAEAAARIMAQHGVPDLVVNNAGTGRWLALWEAQLDDIESAISAPLKAYTYVSRAFLPAMLARNSGTLVFVNSPFSRVVLPGATAYCATRWAVRGLVQAVRSDVSRSNLRVVELVQGATWSNYWQANPGALERVPAVAALLPWQTSAQAGRALWRCLLSPRNTYWSTWSNWAISQLHAVAPGPLQALLTATGFRPDVALLKDTQSGARSGGDTDASNASTTKPTGASSAGSTTSAGTGVLQWGLSHGISLLDWLKRRLAVKVAQGAHTGTGGGATGIGTDDGTGGDTTTTTAGASYSAGASSSRDKDEAVKLPTSASSGGVGGGKAAADVIKPVGLVRAPSHRGPGANLTPAAVAVTLPVGSPAPVPVPEMTSAGGSSGEGGKEAQKQPGGAKEKGAAVKPTDMDTAGTPSLFPTTTSPKGKGRNRRGSGGGGGGKHHNQQQHPPHHQQEQLKGREKEREGGEGVHSIGGEPAVVVSPPPPGAATTAGKAKEHIATINEKLASAAAAAGGAAGPGGGKGGGGATAGGTKGQSPPQTGTQ